MNIDVVFHHNPSSDFGKFRVLHLIIEELKRTTDFTYRIVDPNTLSIPMSSNVANLKGLLMCTLINKSTNKAILINLADRLEPNILPNHGYDQFSIEQIIGGMSVSKFEYDKQRDFIKDKRLPLMIPVDKVSEDEYLLSYTKIQRPKIKKAFFLGNVYSGRSEIVDILKKHPLFEIQHSIREEGLPFKDYIEEMQKYSLCLSLNGFAEICYRDIEAMATYVPIIRSEFLNEYYGELIPNFHYIVGSEPCDDGFLRYEKPSKYIAEQFIEKVEEVIENEDYLNFIAENGRKYYEENCNIKAIVKNAIKLININLLK